MPANIHGDVVQAPRIDGDTVELVVGPDAEALIVHESLLRPRSAFFDAALNKCWKEGVAKRVVMPEDAPDVVRLYIQCLYGGKIYLEWTKTRGKLSNGDNIPEYTVLAEAYVFGERVQDVVYKNSIIDAFVARLLDMIDGSSWFPITTVVDIIYNGITASSLARQLMVDLHLAYEVPTSLGAIYTQTTRSSSRILLALRCKLVGSLFRWYH
ncbi:hypothetical protein LTR17_008999 [Elasticomyces elasticus]|nr:hypothetical protein LTR17_008999 [Elasticomyces elasticus]